MSSSIPPITGGRSRRIFGQRGSSPPTRTSSMPCGKGWCGNRKRRGGCVSRGKIYLHHFRGKHSAPSRAATEPLSDQQGSGPYQVGQLRPLIRVQNGVHPAHRTADRGLEIFSAFHAE